MGQFLLCAGTKGKRYALTQPRIISHQPTSPIGVSASDINKQPQQKLHIKQVLLQLISDHTGQPLEQVIADADRDRWFTAEQAKEYGMVDRVVESLADVRPAGSQRRLGL